MKDFLLKAWAWIRKYLIAPLPIILVVAGAVILVALGAKNVQIGGILAKLTGKKTDGKKAVDVANTIPEDRVGVDGKVIPIGTPDSKGQTQAVVVPIESPGIFSNPDTVTIINPEDQKPVVVQLPDGVKAHDVDKVVVVSPEVHVVTVKDTSKVSGKDVDDLLTKYGKK
jgi:hypothetical protein